MSFKKSLIFVYANQFGYHTDSYKYCLYLKSDFDIIYYCFDQGLEKIGMEGIDIRYLPYNTGKIRRLLNFYYQVIKLSKLCKIDLLFVIHFKFCFILGLFATARVKILDFRTGDLNRNNTLRYFKNKTFRIESLFFKNKTIISEGLRDVLGVGRKNSFILPLGGDCLSEKKHKYERLDLLYVGSLTGRNIFQTIEGISIFFSRNPEYRKLSSYTLVGFGRKEDINLIELSIDKYNLKEIVSFRGRIIYTDLPQFFDRCNLGVTYIPIDARYEHQPATKIFEYSNSGLFNIATDTYENRKLIHDDNGIVCRDNPQRFAEALEKYCSIRGTIDEQKIRDSLKSYTWRSIVRNSLKPYLESLLQK